MDEEPLDILLIEDEPADARLIQAEIAALQTRRFRLTHVTRLTDAEARLAQSRVDLVLLDLSLPDGQGLDSVRRVHAAAPGVPIVVMTGNPDESLAIQAVRVGVQDYLFKGEVDARTLVRAIERSCERKRAAEIQARQAMEARLLHRAVAMASETTSFDDALREVLRMVCEETGWPVGHVYLPATDGSRELAPADIWHADDPSAFAEFREHTMRTRFAPGVGLPGRILQQRAPAWVASIERDANFLRGAAARRCGLKSALGFPILSGGTPIAVVEFFARREISEDRGLLDVMRSVAEQLGRVFDRRQAQDALRASEERFQLAVRGTNDGIFDWNILTGEVYNSPRLLEMCGYTAAEFGNTFAAFESRVHPDDHPGVFAAIRSHLEHGTPFEAEFRLRTASGDYRWVRSRGAAVRDADGRPVRMAGAVTDVTRERQLNERLRLQAAALEAAADGVVITDREGVILWSNPAFSRMCGYTQDELRGQHTRLLKSGRHDRAVYAELWATILAGRTWHGELVNRRKDGQCYDEGQTITPIRDESQRITHFIAIKQDITQRKRTERTLAERTRLATLTAEVGVALTRSGDLRRMLQTCAERLVEHLDAAFARIWIHDPDERVLKLEASAGLYTHLDGAHGRVRVGELKIGRIAASRRPLLTNAVQSDPQIGDPDWARREGMVAFAGYPLLQGEQLMGVMAAFARHELSEAALNAMASIADGIALAIGRDRAEAALRVSEERTRLIVESALDAVVTIDAAGRITGWNPQAEVVFGWSRAQALGRRVDELIIPEPQRAAHCAGVERFLATGEAPLLNQRIELTAIHRDGHEFPIELALTALRAGPTVQFSAFVRDITARQRMIAQLNEARQQLERRVHERTAELAAANARLRQEVAERRSAQAALAISERRLNAILEHATAVVFVKDLDGRFLIVNRRFQELFHRTPEQVLGRTIAEVFPPEFAEPLMAHDRMVLESGRAIEFEERVPQDDGVHSYLSLKFPLLDDRGQIYALCCIATDITDRQRTAEALEQAKRAAEIANQAKSEFLATMSHELRTPLNGVIGMTELLLGTDLDAQQRRYAWLAKTSGDHLLRLINDILDFSKIEAGRVELECSPFDLHHAIESAVAAQASSAESKGIELICSLHPDLPQRTRGDAVRFQQILTNLVHNAVKFTQRGEVVVRAAPDEDQAPPPEGADPQSLLIRVSVTDTGIGIPPERTDRLFQSFSQIDASTTRQFGGTGLGLAICKRLVELMGGRIGVTSKPGAGSTFWFTVPLQRDLAAAPAPAPTRPVSGPRVLVVDDNATNREIVRQQLRSAGLSSDAVASGPDALKLLREAAQSGRPYDVAVLDFHMPGMDGVQLARSIHADDATRRTPLVLLSSSGGPNDAEAARRLGFAGWLVKPARRAELLDAVFAAANAKPSALPGAPHLAELPAPAGSEPSTAAPRGARILVAEDNDISQEVARAILHRAGHECVVVADGRRAVDAVRTGRFDLVLMDCQMPEMDGFAATREIRALERAGQAAARDGGTLPIIALTANAVKGDRERCLDVGMSDYIAKPLEPERLIRLIERHLARQETPDARRAGASPTPRTTPAGPQTSASPAVEPSAPHVDADAPRPADPSPAFDVVAVRRRCGADADFVRRLIGKFQQRLPRDLAELERAIAAGDAGRLTRLSHALKGVAANLEARRLRDIAAELEALGRGGNLAAAPRLFESLRVEARRCADFCVESVPTVAATDSGPPPAGEG